MSAAPMLGAMAALVVLIGVLQRGAVRRATVRRLATLVPAPAEAKATHAGSDRLARLGSAVVRRVRPGADPPPPAVARRLGLAVVSAPLVVVLGPAGLLPGLAFVLAGVAAWRRARTDGPDAVRSLPDAIDLLAIAARGGLPARAAVVAVAGRAPPPWADALAAVGHRCARGDPLAAALDALSPLGDPARPLVTVLRDAAIDGGDLHRDLVRLASDAREVRRRAAEHAARRVPVRLLLPLVTCSLPAFGLLTVAPALAGALGSLRL